MTTEQFSSEFDTLAGSYLHTLPLNIAGTIYEFDEYEKSVFLTKALEALILNAYSSSTTGDSFETSEEVRRYLDGVVKTYYPKTTEGTSLAPKLFTHIIYKLPDDIWFIVYEEALYGNNQGSCISGFTAEVVPVTHDSYYRTVGNPFRGPSIKRVLRLDSGNNTVELVSKYPIASYKIRYIALPSPIILENLEEGLEINKETKRTECKLNSALHGRILEMAVQLALASRSKKTE